MIALDNLIFDLQKVGGVSKVWAKIIQNLDKRSKRIKFLESRKSKQNIFRKEVSLENKIITEYLPSAIRRIIPSFVKSEIYHSSYYRISLMSKYNVVTIHDFINELYPNNFNDFILSIIKRISCKLADKIIVVSEQTKSDMLKFYKDIPSSRIHVVHNGVDDDFYPEVNESFQINNNTFNRNNYFLYVGTRGECKNFQYVCKTLSEYNHKNKKRQLVVVGGTDFNEKEYKNIAELGLKKEDIVHIKQISNHQLRLLYSNTIALLIPSVYEGFGLPALEAARCKALVLTSSGGALEEIVGKNKYAFNLNIDKDFCRVVNLGFENEAAEHAREQMYLNSQKFSWQGAADKYLKIYEELLQQ